MSAGSAQPDEVVAGNVYPKYTTRNPLARLLVAGFETSLCALVRRSGARQVHEVGCGEGFLTRQLAAWGCEVRGSDLSSTTIAEARRRSAGSTPSIDFKVADLYRLDPQCDAAELIVCCEVLEHLPDPVRALDVLARLARPHLITSVPSEPLWRILNIARARYCSELGNTPGHLQHWSRRAFTRLLAQRFEVVEVRSPLPWTMALCRVRRAR